MDELEEILERHTKPIWEDSHNKAKAALEAHISRKELESRLDELLRIKVDGKNVISSPDDEWKGPTLEERLTELQAQLERVSHA